MNNPKCDYCGATVRLVPHVSRYRRGDRLLPVEVSVWECPNEHPGPDGEPRYRFVDMALERRNNAKANAAWKRHFGEPMPRPRPPGRKPAAPRDTRVVVPLTRAEVRRLDEKRGTMTRAAFVRQAVFGAPGANEPVFAGDDEPDRKKR